MKLEDILREEFPDRTRPFFEVWEGADGNPIWQGEEFEARKADISEHGLRNKIVMDQDQRIVDGRNRYRALLHLGYSDFGDQIETVHFKDDEARWAYVTSSNIHRTQWSKESLKSYAIRRRKAGATVREIAKETGKPKSTVSDALKSKVKTDGLSESGQTDQPEEPILTPKQKALAAAVKDYFFANTSYDKLAKKHGVAKTTLVDAVKRYKAEKEEEFGETRGPLALKEMDAGMGRKEAAYMYGIKPSSIYDANLAESRGGPGRERVQKKQKKKKVNPKHEYDGKKSEQYYMDLPKNKEWVRRAFVLRTDVGLIGTAMKRSAFVVREYNELLKEIPEGIEMLANDIRYVKNYRHMIDAALGEPCQFFDDSPDKNKEVQ